jgi:hypothetical protein
MWHGLYVNILFGGLKRADYTVDPGADTDTDIIMDPTDFLF